MIEKTRSGSLSLPRVLVSAPGKEGRENTKGLYPQLEHLDSVLEVMGSLLGILIWKGHDCNLL